MINVLNLKPSQTQIDLSIKWCENYNMDINNNCILS